MLFCVEYSLRNPAKGLASLIREMEKTPKEAALDLLLDKAQGVLHDKTIEHLKKEMNEEREF